MCCSFVAVAESGNTFSKVLLDCGFSSRYVLAYVETILSYN